MTYNDFIEAKKEELKQYDPSVQTELGTDLPCDLKDTFAALESFLTSALNEAREILLDEVEERITRSKDVEAYDIMVCSKCSSSIRERTSHHSEDGFSQCCGKKLKRLYGTRCSYSSRNDTIDEIVQSLRNKE